MGGSHSSRAHAHGGIDPPVPVIRLSYYGGRHYDSIVEDNSRGGDNSSRGGGRGLSTLSASEKEEFERSQFDEALRASRQDFDRR